MSDRLSAVRDCLTYLTAAILSYSFSPFVTHNITANTGSSKVQRFFSCSTAAAQVTKEQQKKKRGFDMVNAKESFHLLKM
jgi:hypothetical protein